MARPFPRFLYSDPRNTKSEGPFIVSTLEPLIICKIHTKQTAQYSFTVQLGTFTLEFLSLLVNTPNGYSDEVKETMFDMAKWLRAQIESGAVTLPVVEKRANWEYRLFDDGGFNIVKAKMKIPVGENLTAYGYLYDIVEIDEKTGQIHAERRGPATQIQINTLPFFG